MGGGMKNVVYASERAEVVHGHWAFKGTAYGCSRCGHGAITPFGNYCEGCGAKMDALPDGRLAQGRAPDRVDVVRCRECVHRPNNLGAIVEPYDIEFPDDFCPLSCGDHWYNKMPEPDWFCGSGERRDGDGEEGKRLEGRASASI